MQRPESRRAGRRNAPAYGPQPPGPQPSGLRSDDPQPPRTNPPGPGWYEPPPDPYGIQPGYGPDDSTLLSGPGPVSPGPVNAGPGRNGGRSKRGRGRIRRFFRLRTVRVILALIAVLLCWAGFSVGQALAAPGGGSTAAKLAEWARDHYLGPVVTFGEWISYNPPKTGGKPGFSLAAPSGETPAKTYKHTNGFVPDIPAKLASPAGHALPGEGAWRVLETVKGYPAIFGTFLRPSAVYSSYVAGLVSMDQRLVKFGLRPGAEDPGPGHWKASTWIPPGTRTGLLATFNGGFKLDSARGGFYLNGSYNGALVNGAASVVYYRNGTIKIGSWGRELRMTPDVAGVRQNLKLLVDHGHIPATVDQNVNTKWGATLGGGYYVWRSGLGITRDGRVIFVYGPALNVRELASLLHRAGAVEALQLDINPQWMSYDYYKAAGHPQNPTPHALLPTQQGSVDRYYQVYSRDFTAVYSR
ncbi:MAG: phosphodiester glycosidase family protein [Streptosporangiaceae bacterium]